MLKTGDGKLIWFLSVFGLVGPAVLWFYLQVVSRTPDGQMGSVGIPIVAISVALIPLCIFLEFAALRLAFRARSLVGVLSVVGLIANAIAGIALLGVGQR